MMVLPFLVPFVQSQVWVGGGAELHLQELSELLSSCTQESSHVSLGSCTALDPIRYSETGPEPPVPPLPRPRMRSSHMVRPTLHTC